MTQSELKQNKTHCEKSPNGLHNFPIVGGDCTHCFCNQYELSGMSLRRGFQRALENDEDDEDNEDEEDEYEKGRREAVRKHYPYSSK